MFDWKKHIFDEGDLIAFKFLDERGMYNQYNYFGQPFFTINPMKQAKGNDLGNIAKYKNILIEFDKEDWGKVKQMNIAKKFELPFALATFSGGKSIHFIISLKDPFTSAELYTRTALLIQLALGADDSTNNPNRLSRTPGAERSPGVVQELVEIGNPVTQLELYRWMNSQQLVAPRIQRARKQLAEQDASKRMRAITKSDEGDAPLKTILPKIYQDMVEHGVKHPECETRHDSLKKFLVWLANNWHDETMIEDFLNRAANAMGIGDRNDVEGLMRWKYGSSGEFKR